MLLTSVAGAPAVAILGPTAWAHKPVGDRNVVVCAHLDRSPCLTVHNQKHVGCMHGTNVCMTRIGVDEVFDAVREALPWGAGSALRLGLVYGLLDDRVPVGPDVVQSHRR